MYEKERDKIEKIIKKKELPLILAIDGRCASGKTTFGKLLQERLGANRLQMDDFFLQPFQRTPERYATPGENVDHERVREVLESWLHSESFRYQMFDCQTMTLSSFYEEEHRPILIVEGSYSMHPELLPYYGYTIFFTVNMEERLRRILERNGAEKKKVFEEKWIPLEEKYFQHFAIAEKADIIIDTGMMEEENA